jgi:hypothetical protein
MRCTMIGGNASTCNLCISRLKIDHDVMKCTSEFFREYANRMTGSVLCAGPVSRNGLDIPDSRYVNSHLNQKRTHSLAGKRKDYCGEIVPDSIRSKYNDNRKFSYKPSLSKANLFKNSTAPVLFDPILIRHLILPLVEKEGSYL